MLGRVNPPFLSAGAAIFVLLVFSANATPSQSATVEELKARLTSARAGDRIQLCIEIAEQQLEAADKFYLTDETEKARTALDDVASFAEQARDSSIQLHKRQKQTEIAVRKMVRKLFDIKRAVNHEEQAPVQAAIDRLQRVRDDLLAAMFPKERK
jgi:NADH dehydrogenase/NADH:ubiquinone oxidoreductase subunit G